MPACGMEIHVYRWNHGVFRTKKEISHLHLNKTPPIGSPEATPVVDAFPEGLKPTCSCSNKRSNDSVGQTSQPWEYEMIHICGSNRRTSLVGYICIYVKYAMDCLKCGAAAEFAYSGSRINYTSSLASLVPSLVEINIV